VPHVSPILRDVGTGSDATIQTEAMKSFWITIRMGRSDILDSQIEDDALETWLQEKLQHATSLLSGNGKVSAERVDPLRVDVDLNFTAQGLSVADIMERFRDDFRALGPITQGIEISETKNYKLCFPRINGEQFPVFVRIDPDSGHPIYTED
jgi:hypothetical protein